VVAAHFYLCFYPDISLIQFMQGFATTLIDLSFAISGYVISSILVKEIDQLKTDQVNLIAFLKGFLIKRLFRIYPALWSVFFLVFLLSIIFTSTNVFSTPYNAIKTSLTLLTSTYNYFLIDNNYPFVLIPLWSITIEEQFYLIFPIFLLLTKNNKQRVKIFVSLIILITFILRPLTVHYYGRLGLYFTQTRCDAILYGCLIYILTQQPWFASLKPAPRHNRWLQTAFLSLIFYIMIGITTLGYSPVIYLPINCLLISILLITATFKRNMIILPMPMQKMLDLNAPRSYTLYLIHTPIIMMTNVISTDYLPLANKFISIKILAAIFLILLTNEILYRLILLPSMKKGKAISENLRENVSKNPQFGINFILSTETRHQD